jgi:hypothetical protein
MGKGVLLIRSRPQRRGAPLQVILLEGSDSLGAAAIRLIDEEILL